LTILVILVMRLIGLVTRLARPGANVTGLSFFFLELVGKCLEQFKQAVPGGVGRRQPSVHVARWKEHPCSRPQGRPARECRGANAEVRTWRAHERITAKSASVTFA